MPTPRRLASGCSTAAAELLRRQGYAATGWREVVAESGTPWGSQWHHFPGGKEQLAAEALSTGRAEYLHALQAAFGSMHPADAVLAWAKSGGCAARAKRLVARLSARDRDARDRARSDALAEVCEQAFTAWTARWATRSSTTAWRDARRRRLATVVLAAMEGALHAGAGPSQCRAAAHGGPRDGDADPRADRRLSLRAWSASA